MTWAVMTILKYRQKWDGLSFILTKKDISDMTNKECVERWAENIIPAVFRAEDALLKNKPEWKERIANATDDYMSDLAKEYCTEIAEIIVRGADDFDEEEGL